MSAAADARARALVSRILKVAYSDQRISMDHTSARDVGDACSSGGLAVHGHFGLGYVEIGRNDADATEAGASNVMSSLISKRLSGDARRKKRRMEMQGREADEELAALGAPGVAAMALTSGSGESDAMGGREGRAKSKRRVIRRGSSFVAEGKNSGKATDRSTGQ